MPVDRSSRDVAVQIAETPAEPGDDPRAGGSCYPTDLDNEARDKVKYEEWDRIPLSPDLTKKAESFAQSARRTADSAMEVASIAVKDFVPRTIPSFNPRSPQETPLPSDRSEVMSKWINENQLRLCFLRRSNLDCLLDDIAAEFISQRFKTQPDLKVDNESLDHRIDQWILSIRNFICFVSRVLKLHWYLGHNGWSGVIEELDGQFPQSPSPCFAWIEMHRDDAPWWKLILDGAAGAELKEDIDNGRESHLMALTRAWLFPAVYREATEAVRSGEYVVTENIYQDLFESGLMISFCKCLSEFVDPWLYAGTEDVQIPVCLSEDELNDDDENDVPAVLDNAQERGNSVRSVLDKLLRTCRDRMIESPDWATGFDEAFPDAGSKDEAFPDVDSKPHICDLVQRKRLGFSLREIEVEVEGETAWLRHIYHTVFEDAYGPQAIARELKKRIRSRVFRVLGSAAAAFSFKEKSDYCQMLLREVVIRILKGLHGDSWLKKGVDDRTRNKVKGVRGAKDEPDSWLEQKYKGIQKIEDFFENTDIIDYINVLNHDPNFLKTKWLLSKVGCEWPTKKKTESLKLQLCFNDWNTARNASAHPERQGYDSFSDALEKLDKVQRILTIWAMLTETYDDMSDSGV